MRAKVKIFTLSVLSFFIFSVFVSCPSIFSSMAMFQNNQVQFSLSIKQATSRSALATESVSFANANYTYTLTATSSSGTTSGTTTTIFSDASYSYLSQSFSLSAGTYTFVLYAYSGSSQVFSGTVSDYVLTGEGNSISFYMQALQGYSGTATVTLELPDDYEDTVVMVKAGVASIPFAQDTECDYISATELEIDTSGLSADPATPATVTFSSSSFVSGRTQFVIFYLYDINGAIVATIPESVVIAPGKTSSSTISNSSYNLYDIITYSLRISGTPTKTYYLTGEEFDPSGISVYCDGAKSDGTSASSFEVASTFYTTNFEDLVGCDQTLTISYQGLSVDMDTVIHRATYELTEEATLIESYSGYASSAGTISPSYSGTSDVPAVFYKFGDWPQSIMASGITLSSGTASNGYYIGSDGCYYMLYSSSYYKIEPIVWRCLNTATGSSENYQTINKAFLMSEICLESGVTFYENKGTNRTIDGTTVYSTNWEYSTIRAYLNGLNGANYDTTDYTDGGFLNTAFTNDARGLIYKTLCANDSASNSSYSDDVSNRPSGDYCGNNTYDKIFLMSMYEITNPYYGFSSSGTSDDSARKRYRSDYSDGRAYAKDGYTHYWLRSQYYSTWYKGNNARYVKDGGNPSNYDGVDCTDKGIVPALWVSLNGYVDAIKVSGTLSNQYYGANDEFDPTGITVTYYDENGSGTTISYDESGSSGYTTNFSSLSGANQTLLISYSGLSAEVEQLVHRATYEFTESPTQIDYDDAILNTTDGEISASLSTGTYYKFGDYPQSAKDSDVSLSSGTVPSGKDGEGYYIGTDGNYYALYGTSYYKIEPIIWRCLTTSTDTGGTKALLFSEFCIDSGVVFYYNDTRSCSDPYVRRYTGEETVEYEGEGEEDSETGENHTLYAYGYACQIYPNNYKYSTIRAYLNSIDASTYHGGASDTSVYDFSSSSSTPGFLTQAFTSSAQGRIVCSTVDNSTSSAVSCDGSTGDPQITRLCPDTQDKVFLLSLNEITNGDYGFATSGSSDDSVRKKYRSDYANARGVYTKSGYAHYLIRTPYSEDTSYDKQNFRYVKEGGNPNNYDGVENSDKGIVPALWVYTGSEGSYTEDTSEVTTDDLYESVDTETTFADNTLRTLENAVDLYNLVSEGYNGAAYGPIIVTKGYLVDKDDAANYETEGEEIYLITLSGTEIVDGQSTGVWTDLQSGFNGSSDYLTNVGYVITGDSDTYDTTLTEYGYGTASGNGAITAGLPENSKIIIAGHSLGGMIAQQTSAEDAVKNGYEVLNVVTFGSPLLSEGSREGTLHRLCDRSDIVPFASGSLISSSTAQWNDREVEDGAYGEEIYSTSGLIAHMTGAAADTRDTTGPHCQSYKRNDVWGDYDVLGELRGSKVIILDNSTKTFFANPDLD